MPKFKATAYIRLSYTDDRSSESDSVSNQRRLIENFVERNPDIEVVSEKIDDGYSGIIFDRPAFKEMMQDITDGNINCVIVKDLSRLGREYIETGRYLRRVFPAYGVRFIAITDNIDTAHDSSGDDLTVSVKNIMNEAYCRDISIKTRSSLDVKRRNGDFVGAFTVYGYMKSEDNKNQLVPDPYASYKAKYTRQAEDIRESVRTLKEKLTEVLENRSERNRWISQFTQFSALETLDRRALIHMVQSIRVRGKKELDITFTHEDEYKKALQLLTLAAQQKDYEQRKVG
jgi:DNA invertase Pin-like site-specific DNA recombinase